MSRSRTSPEARAPDALAHDDTLLVVLAGPSGTGKSTLLERAFAVDPRLAFSVSHTTRPPRPGEVDGQAYHFVDDATFDRMIEVNAFAEWAHVHARRYGTSRAEVQRLRDADRDIVFDVDVQGAASLAAAYPEAVTLFILPPSLASLERRLRGRGTEDEAHVAIRLANARREIEKANTFTYTIVNDDVERAATALVAIIRAERQRTARRPDLALRVLAGDDLSPESKTPR